MKKLIMGLALSLTLLSSSTPTAAAVSIQGTYSQWELPPSGAGYYNLDMPVFTSNDPQASPGQATPAYYYATQFWFANPGLNGGYIGLQSDGDGKRAIFSIWDASDAACGPVVGAICRPFSGEGEGYQTMIPYDWQAGHAYRTRVWAVGVDEGGAWWLGAILDDMTGADTIIGTIRVPHGRGWLGGTLLNFVEWYGPQPATCQDLPISVVFFGPPRGDNGAVVAGAPRYAYGTGACPSSITPYGEWARHRNGWGD